ncbi:glycosyltransferase family 4 protein [Chryseobacterium chendengshani]|uniref:glycosyltransferase family 4 protein n=1 Tax=Chryseobacterium sp. LJ668 TaxID=2864040 RepID=UPI001C688C76|nr:glycosyltransferase family 4 protein [Chryseobacterium sp. LJ668]MBW8521827.1 glycosyltransferase family 4 protein [Chryseobacterium sp. LJ668]QYK17487.1 glycosyltransferase family 4 protein [Chryseobacterium sp. LJ668]
MKIGFYSVVPLDDKKNWSGTMFKMYEQLLIQGHEVVWIPRVRFTDIEKKTFKFIEKTFNKIFNRGYNRHLFIYKAKIAARRLEKNLKDFKIDVLFNPTHVNDFAYLKTDIPVVYLNDANVAQLLNYYHYYSGFGILSKLETKYLEKKTLKKSSFAVFSSDWASNFAVDFYGIEKEKVKTIKFGANIMVPEKINFNKNTSEFTFLFLAVDWVRKRGTLAFESLKILREKGLPVKMLIVGCDPEINEDWVTIIPFLNKNNPDEFKEIQQHLLNSHFLFVPTKADCTPIAFCEAAGYGLPVISTNTGGISAHVIHGYNGILLSPNAVAQDYADEMEKLMNAPEKVKEYSENARKLYDQELNWENWGNEFSKILKKLG